MAEACDIVPVPDVIAISKKKLVKFSVLIVAGVGEVKDKKYLSDVPDVCPTLSSNVYITVPKLFINLHRKLKFPAP